MNKYNEKQSVADLMIAEANGDIDIARYYKCSECGELGVVTNKNSADRDTLHESCLSPASHQWEIYKAKIILDLEG